MGDDDGRPRQLGEDRRDARGQHVVALGPLAGRAEGPFGRLARRRSRRARAPRPRPASSPASRRSCSSISRVVGLVGVGVEPHLAPRTIRIVSRVRRIGLARKRKPGDARAEALGEHAAVAAGLGAAALVDVDLLLPLEPPFGVPVGLAVAAEIEAGQIGEGCGPARRSSVLHDGDVRRIDRLHADHVVAGIDVVDLAGDGRRQVGQEVERGIADLLDRDGALQRRVVLVPLQDVAEVADAGGGERLDRAGRDGVDADRLARRGRRRGSARRPRARPWRRP